MPGPLPAALTVNAFTGVAGQETSAVGPRARVWGTRRERPRPGFLAAVEIDYREWRRPDVGWGLLLPENEGVSEAGRARAEDAPEPIRLLLEARPDSPVFRYREDVDLGYLRRYYVDGPRQDVAVHGARGTARGAFPYYLLIVGSPTEIPWEVQFFLNQACYAGRLDLDGAGLASYIGALIEDFGQAAAKPSRPVVWAVDHGPDDITWLMRATIAEPLRKKLAEDDEIGTGLRWLTGANATAGRLRDNLVERRPALVITTSHGMTGPLDEAGRMADQLGLPVDIDHQLVRPEGLLDAWQPEGAVWLSQACCSAGCDGENRYRELLAPGSTVERILDKVAAIGPRVAPLPRALLGAGKPLRAFIGQVDPTFDWTLRAPTGQVLTEELHKAIYPNMHLERPQTVGMSFDRYFSQVGVLFRRLERARRQANAMQPGARTSAVEARLTACDRESLVILGDPTVAVPALSERLE